jgi:hypothetical protein
LIDLPIPASQIVSVTPRIIAAGGNELAMTGLFLTKNPLVPFPDVRPFYSAVSVRSFFGDESAEYNAAAKYFLGYDNSFKKPRVLYFARRVAESIPAYLTGAPFIGSLSDLTAITNGSLHIVINGAGVDAAGIDLSSAVSLSAAAATIAAKITGADVTYSSLTGGFTVTSATAGKNSSVSFASSTGSGADLSSILGLTEAAGAILSGGSDALTGAANMDNVINQTQNFVTFSTLEEPAEEEALSLSDWSNNQGNEFLYVLWTDEPVLLHDPDTASIAYKLNTREVDGVTAVYAPYADYAAMIMGAVASIDWDRPNGVITLAFKSQSGLAPIVNGLEDAEALLRKNVNYYGRWASRADDFLFLFGGKMFGRWKWIDAYINNIWLRNALQLALLRGIAGIGKAPYNERGYTTIRAWCQDPINRALNNKIIEAGVTLSEAQKAEINTEVGRDVSMQIFTNGYYLQVDDPAPEVRAERGSPIIGMWYTEGGSVHHLDVPVTVIM